MSELNQPAAKRPNTVLAVVIVVCAAALLQFAAAAVGVIFALRPGEAQQFLSHPISDWYWIINAALSLVMGLIYIWIARGLLAGDPQAWLLVNLLAIINIFFALFQITYGIGWTAIAVNAILLALNNTSTAKSWFRLPQRTSGLRRPV